MRYDEEILRVLGEAGADGLSVTKISRYVYNACNSFFEPLDYEGVRRDVYQFLVRNSKKPDSLIKKTAVRGVYRLNEQSCEAQQLMIDFEAAASGEPTKEEYKDESLSLF